MNKITTHIDDALSRLLNQYKNKINFSNLISSLVGSIQTLEDVYFDLIEKRSIDIAVGIQLDRLGTIVGQEREGRTDEEYRQRIKARILQNVSQGEPEKLIDLVTLLLNPNLIHIHDAGLGGVLVGFDVSVPSNQLVELLSNLQLVVGAGIRVDYIIEFDSVEPFAFDGDLLGFGFGDDSNPNVGGKFALEYIIPNLEFTIGDDLSRSPDKNSGGFGTTYDPLVGGMFIN